MNIRGSHRQASQHLARHAAGRDQLPLRSGEHLRDNIERDEAGTGRGDADRLAVEHAFRDAVETILAEFEARVSRIACRSVEA